MVRDKTRQSAVNSSGNSGLESIKKFRFVCNVKAMCRSNDSDLKGKIANMLTEKLGMSMILKH